MAKIDCPQCGFMDIAREGRDHFSGKILFRCRRCDCRFIHTSEKTKKMVTEASPQGGRGQRFLCDHTLVLFFTLLSIALILQITPVISIPFLWVNHFFHEMSHGFAALLTGGDIISFKLTLDGRGLCQTSGGDATFVGFAGYFGAVFWGVMLYLILGQGQFRRAIYLISLFVFTMAITAMLWVKDHLTLGIIFLLASSLSMSFVWQYQVRSSCFLLRLVQLMGVFMVSSALFQPFYLLMAKEVGNRGIATNLAYVTTLSEQGWLVLWMMFALFGLFLMAANSYYNGLKQEQARMKLLWKERLNE
ncbi:M50 family metallopeptidase [Magnetococcales bacterium HHB-1]